VSDTELLPKSKPSPPRRVEVFTGTGRRRAWTAEQKARIIAESLAGGETVSAVARRHDLTPQQLFGWLRVARRRMARESGKNEPAFAPVIVEASRSSSIEPRPGGWALIEMVIGAVTVRIPPGIDAVTLMTVLRAVRAAA
jgi:transposase